MPGGRLAHGLETFTRLVGLNALWLLACLPVVTAPVATAALFGVVRIWIRGDQPPVGRTFLALLRENLPKASVVGLGWALVGAVLVVDVALVREMGALREPLLVALLVLGLLYAGTSVFLFPVLVQFDVGPVGVVRTAFLLTFARPLVTLAALAVLAGAAFVVVSLPITLIVAGSATAWAVYWCCDSTFRRVAEAREPR